MGTSKIPSSYSYLLEVTIEYNGWSIKNFLHRLQAMINDEKKWPFYLLYWLYWLSHHGSIIIIRMPSSLICCWCHWNLNGMQSLSFTIHLNFLCIMIFLPSLLLKSFEIRNHFFKTPNQMLALAGWMEEDRRSFTIPMMSTLIFLCLSRKS